MAIQFDICQSFLGLLNSESQSFITDTLQNVASSITPFATTLMAIYLGWFGYRLFFGMVNVQEALPMVIKFMIVFSVATNPSLFNNLIGRHIWELPDALAGLVLNGQTDSSASFLDTLLSQFYELKIGFQNLADRDNTMGIPNLDFMIAGWLVLVAGVLLVLYALFIVVLTKIAIAILLAVAPIFILMISANSTRKFFDAWAAQILSFSFSIMLLSAVLKLNISLLQRYLTGVSANIADTAIDPQIDQLIPIFILAIAAILVLRQVSSMASSLGGGIALSTSGAFQESAKQLGKAAKSLERLRISLPTANPTTNSISKNIPTYKK